MSGISFLIYLLVALIAIASGYIGYRVGRLVEKSKH